MEDAVWEPPSFLKMVYQGSRAPKGEFPQARYPKIAIVCLRTFSFDYQRMIFFSSPFFFSPSTHSILLPTLPPLSFTWVGLDLISDVVFKKPQILDVKCALCCPYAERFCLLHNKFHSIPFHDTIFITITKFSKPEINKSSYLWLCPKSAETVLRAFSLKNDLFAAFPHRSDIAESVWRIEVEAFQHQTVAAFNASVHPNRIWSSYVR